PLDGPARSTENVSWPVSRVLCRRLSPPRWPFIWDACCQAPQATNPDGDAETHFEARNDAPGAVPIRFCSRRGLPCHVCYQPRGALLPHPFTLALLWPTALRAT